MSKPYQLKASRSHTCDVLQLEAGMESHQRMVSDKLSVGELMTTQMTALEPIMLVSKLETVLRRCAHQAFPITSEVEKAFAASMLLHLAQPVRLT